MFNYLQKKGFLFAIICWGLFPLTTFGQMCDGQEESLDDTQIPVAGISSSHPEAYCLYFRFDSDITGWPTGITMDLWHEYEGDLGIFVEACGERLNVLQRPGSVGNCDEGCSGPMSDCGSSAQIGMEGDPVIINFFETGAEPDFGISGGGSFGLTADDDCGVSTLTNNTFQELWSNCPLGLVEAEICFTDHAFLHRGFVSNLNFIFPNPYICGCMDEAAINYNPDASVSSGDCYYDCPDLGLMVENNAFNLCAGGDTITVSASANLANAPTFEWVGTGLGTSFLKEAENGTTDICIPADFVGLIVYTVTARDAFGCMETETVTVTVSAAPDVSINGQPFVCGTDSTLLVLEGGPFTGINWSNGETTDSIYVGAGSYSVTVSDGGSCTSVATTAISGFATPMPLIAGPDTICYTDTVLLTTDTIYNSYLWSTGDTLPFIAVNSPQLYELTVVDSNGCTGTASFQLHHYDSLAISISGPAVFCPGDSITLSTDLGLASYLWSTGDTTATTSISMPGMVQVMVSDSNACTAQAMLLVEELIPPAPIIRGPDFLCPGELVELSVDEPYSTFLWPGGDADSLFVTDTAGLFSVLVEDSLGCQGTAVFELLDADPVVAVIDGNTMFCIGDSTELSVTPGFANYVWSNAATGASVTINQTGDYSVTVSSDQGCSTVLTTTLSNFTQQGPLINGPTQICAGSSTTIVAETGYSNYTWSDGQTGPSIEVDSSGTYNLIATDANGCQVSSSFDLLVRPDLSLEVSGDTLICLDGSGLLVATPGFSTYNWSTTEVNDSIIVDGAATYSVTATDDFGCEVIAEALVETAVVAPEIDGQENLCAGETMTLSLTETFDTYLWSTTSQADTLVVDAGGTYMVTVTNSLGCNGEATFDIDELDLPLPVISGETTFCEGDATVLDGGASYQTYQWSVPGNTDRLLNVSAAGIYGLTVTDANGCSGDTMIAVDAFPLPVPEIVGDLDFCPNGTTTLSSATAYPSYTWSTGDTEQSTIVDMATLVTLTVVDTNNCEGATTTQTAIFSTDVPEIQGNMQFCVGKETVLSLDQAFSTYSWTGGQTGPTATYSDAGQIAVTVTDDNGCVTNDTTDLSFFPEEPLLVQAPVGFCVNESATLTAAGNFMSYLWSTTEDVPEIIVNTAGEYSLTATDGNGCEVSDTFMVEAFPLPVPEISGLLTFCEGFSTSLSSETDFPEYLWSTMEVSQSIQVDMPGPISLTVTDANGCQGTVNEMLETAEELTPTILGEPGLCPGDSTTLYLNDVYASYDWSNGSTSDTIVVYDSGTYSLEVSDLGGCMGTASIEVAAYLSPTVDIASIGYFCEQGTTTLTASPSNGNLLWSTGEVTASIEVAAIDNYAVTLTDANGCTATDSEMISMEPLPAFDILGPREYCENAAATLSVNDEFESYLWSTGEMENSVTLNEPGQVAVTVTDANGCQASEGLLLQENQLPQAFAGQAQAIDCDTEIVMIGSELSSSGPNISYQWTGPGIDEQNDTLQFLEVGQAGLYTLVVIDNEHGCVSDSVSVPVEDLRYEPQVVLSLLDELDCTTSSVTIDGTESANGPAYIYQWLDDNNNVIPGATDTQLETSLPQMYTLLVVDTITGCRAAAEIEVTLNEDYPAVEAGTADQLDCGNSTAILNGTVSPIGDHIEFHWLSPNGSFVGPNFELETTVDAPAWYYLEATDIDNGCTNIDSVLVTQDIAIPTVITSDDITLLCDEENTTLSGAGSATGSAFSYQWLLNNELLNGENSLNLVAALPGTYTLQIINADNECSASAEVELSLDPAAPQEMEVNFSPPTCEGDSDGRIWIEQVTGGMTPYVYSFNNQPFTTLRNFNSLPAGQYELIVEDANGCQLSSLLELPDGNDVQLELGPDQRIEEGELVDIYPQISIDSSLIQSLEWQTAATLPCPECITQVDIALEQSTQFFLTVTDENGCSDRDYLTIFVEKDRGIYVPNGFSPNGDGRNDRFYIFTDSKSVEEIKLLRIFNRWGEFVWENKNFQPNDPRAGWDGMQYGMDPNPAVYVWYAEITLKTGEEILLKGDVTLVE